MIKKKFLLGIIGGMGSEATNLFFQKIIESTRASNDEEHIPTIILNQTKIPHFHTNYNFEKNVDSEPDLSELIDLFINLEVRAVAIACNTIHKYERLFRNKQFKFINMIESTINYLSESNSSKGILLIASDVTVKSKLYQNKSKLISNISINSPNSFEQNKIDSIIESLKNTSKRDIKHSAIDLLEILEDYDFNNLIFVIACTELSLLVSQLKFLKEINIVDALDVLAVKTIKYLEFPLNIEFIKKHLTCKIEFVI